MEKRVKVIFRGRPNLTPPKIGEGAKGEGKANFLFMDGFEWGKRVSCLELSTSLKFLERGEEANFFVFGHFLCFNESFCL